MPRQAQTQTCDLTNATHPTILGDSRASYPYPDTAGNGNISLPQFPLMGVHRPVTQPHIDIRQLLTGADKHVRL